VIEWFIGRWTHDEHQLFLEGLKLYKKQWKQIADLIKTRTVVQIRTHAQKYFQKLMKMNKTDEYDESFLQEFVVNNQNTPYGVNNLKVSIYHSYRFPILIDSFSNISDNIIRWIRRFKHCYKR